MILNVLTVGDVVGEQGLDFLTRHLRALQKLHDIHFTVVNGENASGVGILPAGQGHLRRRGRRGNPGEPHLEPHPDQGPPPGGALAPPSRQLHQPGSPAGDWGSTTAPGGCALR